MHQQHRWPAARVPRVDAHVAQLHAEVRPVIEGDVVGSCTPSEQEQVKQNMKHCSWKAHSRISDCRTTATDNVNREGGIDGQVKVGYIVLELRKFIT